MNILKFFDFLSERSRGPLLMLLGGCLLTLQLVLFFSNGWLSAYLIGGGLAALICGALLWFYYWDDQFTSGENPFQQKEEDPDFTNINADEYSRRFEYLEDDDPGGKG